MGGGFGGGTTAATGPIGAAVDCRGSSRERKGSGSPLEAGAGKNAVGEGDAPDDAPVGRLAGLGGLGGGTTLAGAPLRWGVPASMAAMKRGSPGMEVAEVEREELLPWLWLTLMPMLLGAIGAGAIRSPRRPLVLLMIVGEGMGEGAGAAATGDADACVCGRRCPPGLVGKGSNATATAAVGLGEGASKAAHPPVCGGGEGGLTGRAGGIMLLLLVLPPSKEGFRGGGAAAPTTDRDPNCEARAPLWPSAASSSSSAASVEKKSASAPAPATPAAPTPRPPPAGVGGFGGGGAATDNDDEEEGTIGPAVVTATPPRAARRRAAAEEGSSRFASATAAAEEKEDADPFRGRPSVKEGLGGVAEERRASSRWRCSSSSWVKRVRGGSGWWACRQRMCSRTCVFVVVWLVG